MYTDNLPTPPSRRAFEEEDKTYLMSRNGYKWSRHLFVHLDSDLFDSNSFSLSKFKAL